MAEPETGVDTGAPAINGEDTGPAVGLLTQYVKDLSFENPNAPGIFQATVQPSVDVQFSIASAQVGEEAFEVVIKIEVKATTDSQTAFVVDLSYAGLFGIRNVPADQLEPFLLGEAPRILFPFARRVLADATRDGGFTPLMLEPIDFASLYLQRAAQGGSGSGFEIGQA
ncbi:protein-export chaperone SecB [Sphingomonas sp.]|uniref:protein-export chaperone SecB n=1 Tax=Sphingomonas sp. TaxID=28214 RepID=UPI001B0FFAA5|nr:protein-export chaperone SecB [Sphingomonas sp.]MBO9711532.1 protein-export chaperone SecB [Sphingomonas sp.]